MMYNDKNKAVLLRTIRSTVQDYDGIPRLLAAIMIRLLLQLHYDTIGPCFPLKWPDMWVLSHQ